MVSQLPQGLIDITEEPGRLRPISLDMTANKNDTVRP
jgi:hypothetical protein